MEFAMEISVGDQAHEAIRKLVLADSSLASILICRYPTPPSLQARVALSADEQAIVDHAIEARKDGVTPFWHGVFATCLQSATCTPGIVKGALYHAGPGTIERVDAPLLQRESISDLYNLESEQVGIASQLVRWDGSIVHLTQLDFRCPVSPRNDELVRVICRGLYEHGFVLLDSGHSYHSFGLELATCAARYRFLGRALQFSPVVDTAYIGHQLQQPFSTLRISRGGSANRVPQVVEVHR